MHKKRDALEVLGVSTFVDVSSALRDSEEYTGPGFDHNIGTDATALAILPRDLPASHKKPPAY